MSLFCRLGWHRADDKQVYNSGYYFSGCARCRRDMIRLGAAWQVVPRGHRVVWRSGPGQHSIEPDYGHFLPVLVAESRLPTLWGAWRRQHADLPTGG